MKKQKILCILLAIILLFIFSITSFATDTVQNNQTNSVMTNGMNELNTQKEETEEKLEKVNSQLEYVQGEMSATLVEIQRIDDKVRQYEQENQKYATKLRELETSVKQTEEQLAVLTADYNKKREQLKNRLVALYEAGDIAYLDVLLSAQSLSDFLSIYYIMVEIAEYDSNLMQKVDEQRKAMDVAKRKLENEKSEIRVLKARAEQTEVVLRNNRTLQQGYIKELSEKEQKINNKIQEYKNDVMAIEAKIQQANSNNGEINIQYTGGTMIWPVAISGTGITSYYGTREHPIAGVIRFHQGLDIGNTGFGAPVVAALDGVVTYAGELGSYGNCVMIYHGNGITTLYGHGQAVLTQRGATVKQGDLIMQTGSTGNSTGPHLHFEVRVNGSTTNPLNYVNAP